MENIRTFVTHADRQMLWSAGIDALQWSSVTVSESHRKLWIPKDTLQFIRDLGRFETQARFVRIYAKKNEERGRRMTHKGFACVLESMLMSRGNADDYVVVRIYDQMQYEVATIKRNLLSTQYIDTFINSVDPDLYRMIVHGEKLRATRAHR